VGHELSICCCHLSHTVHVPFGNYQNMDWCMWIDIFDGNAVFVFIDNATWGLSCNDSTEQTFSHDSRPSRENIKSVLCLTSLRRGMRGTGLFSNAGLSVSSFKLLVDVLRGNPVIPQQNKRMKPQIGHLG